MRAASPPRQMERENEMIVISHRLFDWEKRFRVSPGGVLPLDCLQKKGAGSAGSEGLDRLEEDMVMVKTASTERKRMTDQELKMFKKNVKPFLQEDTMRMGLKSGNEGVALQYI